MKALILAAGYATRLYPLTKNFPKPLLDIGGKTILDVIMERLETINPTEVVIVTNHKFAVHFEEWAAGKKSKLPVSVLNDGTTDEDNRLGATGDMALAVDKSNISEDLLVVAGDNLFDFSLAPFVEQYNKHGEVQVGLYEFPKQELLHKYGIVKLDDERKVEDFVEKPENPPSNLVSMCLYMFPAKTLSMMNVYLAEDGAQDAPGHYIRWLMTQGTLYGYPFQGEWLDIGDLDSLEVAKKLF